jgi:hypothetical protein
MDRSGGRNFRIAGRRIVALEGAAPKPRDRQSANYRQAAAAKTGEKFAKFRIYAVEGLPPSNRHTLTKWSPPQLAASSSVIRTARTSDDRSWHEAADLGCPLFGR